MPCVFETKNQQQSKVERPRDRKRKDEIEKTLRDKERKNINNKK